MSRTLPVPASAKVADPQGTGPAPPLPPGVSVQVDGTDLVVGFATDEVRMPVRVECPSYVVRVLPGRST